MPRPHLDRPGSRARQALTRPTYGQAGDDATAARRRNWPLLAALRPEQWVKNALVFAALVFSRSLGQGYLLLRTCEAFALFCAASSAIYLLNDLRDRAEDRLHPVKRLRPLASGALAPAWAWMFLLLLLGVALGGALVLDVRFATLLVIYVLLNVAYSLGLKRLVIVDVLAIATGFVLRAWSGGLVIGVSVTPWLLLCTLMLAMFLAFGKRRHELLLLQHNAAGHRASLSQYSVEFLDRMMTASASVVVVAYALYTLSPETVARFGSQALVFSTPCVIYGIYRYLYLVVERNQGGDPAHALLRDIPSVVNVFCWLAVVCSVLYLPDHWVPW